MKHKLLAFSLPIAALAVASLSPMAMSQAQTEQQGQCSDWTAQLDRMPGPNRQPTLNVKGTCTFPKDGYSVQLKRIAGPQPRDLTLRLQRVVTPPDDQTAQVVSKEAVRYTQKTNTEYRRVLIVPDQTSISVEQRF